MLEAELSAGLVSRARRGAIAANISRRRGIGFRRRARMPAAGGAARQRRDVRLPHHRPGRFVRRRPGRSAMPPIWAAGTHRLADALSGVDLLALEFNHDVAMQRSSGRHPMLIARVLGDEGHLSNAQAAALLRQTLIEQFRATAAANRAASLEPPVQPSATRGPGGPNRARRTRASPYRSTPRRSTIRARRFHCGSVSVSPRLRRKPRASHSRFRHR